MLVSSFGDKENHGARECFTPLSTACHQWTGLPMKVHTAISHQDAITAAGPAWELARSSAQILCRALRVLLGRQ